MKSLKRKLLKVKGRVKECEQIHEFDFAMWEKDCEVESSRKH